MQSAIEARLESEVIDYYRNFINKGSLKIFLHTLKKFLFKFKATIKNSLFESKKEFLWLKKSFANSKNIWLNQRK